MAALFDALPRATVFDLRNRCLLELLYGAALRIGEAIALDADDIDTGRHLVRVREGKGGQSRVVPLTKAAQAAVQDYRAVRRSLLKGPDHGAWFLSQYGTWLRPMSVYGFFEDLNRSRGEGARHLHPHLFRSSAAVHVLRGGADIRHVQQLLGHACLDTTKIYLRLVPGHLTADYIKAMPEIEVGL